MPLAATLLALALAQPAPAAPPAPPQAAPPPLAGPPVALPRTVVEHVTGPDGTPYALRIALPRGHGEAGRRFPVVYLLDADYAFPVVRAAVEHLSDRAGLPELILVGIADPEGIEGEGWLRRYRLRRTRDYTPTRSPEGYPDGVQEVSGGAPRFLDFLERTVFPHVEARTRAAPGERALVGHSYGGLFATWALLTRPGLFSRAVVVSPSLWYDQRLVFRELLPAARERLAGLEARVFLAVGGREGNAAATSMIGSLRELERGLAAAAPRARVRALVLEGETHDSVFPAAVTRGLRDVFDGR